MNISNGTVSRNHAIVPKLNIELLNEENLEEAYVNANMTNLDSPDTPKTPKSPISSIKLPPEETSLKKKKFRQRLSREFYSNPSLRKKSESFKLLDQSEFKKLTSSRQIKHFSLKIPNEESLTWIIEIIRECSAIDLPNIKIQEIAKEILQKLAYDQIKSSFLKFETTIHRICFLNLLSGDCKNQLINLCSNIEIDLMIESVEDIDYSFPKEEHIERCNQIINLLSDERRIEYFKPLQNPEDHNFIIELESCAPIKLNLALKNLWLKNIPALVKAVSITKMLDCPRRRKVIVVTTRDISWRCRQFNSTHWAALLPVLSLNTIKDLRELNHLNNITEHLAYSEMEYLTFKELVKEKKILPELYEDGLLIKLLELKKNSELKAELRSIKRKMNEMDLKLSNILFELKKHNREQLVSLEGLNLNSTR